MVKKAFFGVLLLLLFLPLCALCEQRALLIGCDYFVTKDNTWPAASNNVQMLADTLAQDAEKYTLIRSVTNTLHSKQGLQRTVYDAFGTATEQDVSLFYISTHGVYSENGFDSSVALVLSDGENETLIDIAALADIFSDIKGTKVLIIDACNSGAFIGKGLADSVVRHAFVGENYKVLTSAGGTEESWYWQQAAGNAAAAVQGGSYFLSVLCDGLGRGGHAAADENADNRVTLSEIYRYVLENYAASTPQVYPQEDDDFVLFRVNDKHDPKEKKAISDIVFEDEVLSSAQDTVKFSFTVHKQSRILYELVYYKDGAWQFADATMMEDYETARYGETDTGRKERSLQLSISDDAVSGYAMLLFITMDEDTATLQGSRLLSVQPNTGDPNLKAQTSALFTPTLGQELRIFVAHTLPCSMTVTVRDSVGGMVKRICYNTPSRPQKLSRDGSTFYWNGKTNAGEDAPQGVYTVEVTVKLGGVTYKAGSATFFLIR